MSPRRQPVEHFRVRCNRDDQLAVDGFSRHALALLEADTWPGNVRELGAVVRRAMAVRRRGVGPEDVKLPALRRSPVAPPAPAGVVSGTTAALTRYEAAALQLAGAGGGVRRGDLMAQCGISREAARRTLASLVERGRVRRVGSGRRAWYVLQAPEGAGG
jgi:DNA-binding NtrC family response regulator